MGRQRRLGQIVLDSILPTHDDLGAVLPGTTPQRIVSLVPSLTEAIASTPQLRSRLVACTDWCSHVDGLELTRVRGTKNPRIEQVIELKPDLVIANKEENRKESVADLRDAGVPVYVTDITTVDTALRSMRRLLAYCGAVDVPWLDEAHRVWAQSVPSQCQGVRVVVPIWRKPWMGVGDDTFSHDMLSRLGFENVLAEYSGRYPEFRVDELPPHDLVVLPDEPYKFTQDDGPQYFDQTSVLIDGRYLTWYGPSLVKAREYLYDALSTAVNCQSHNQAEDERQQ